MDHCRSSSEVSTQGEGGGVLIEGGPCPQTASRTGRLAKRQGRVRNYGTNFHICKFGEDAARKAEVVLRQDGQLGAAQGRVKGSEALTHGNPHSLLHALNAIQCLEKEQCA